MSDEPMVPENTPKAEEPKPDPKISINKFFETELRVARILEAERVENADRLLKLQIDLGTERRQLVAGIAESYTPESLIGRSIIVVANLKPARIRGVDSDGMLLAATVDGRAVLASFDGEIPPGTQVG
ncbi:MAG: methionine--tRNA ligase subunit beta [Acidobacteriota bacterium]|nr:methionine--tRNA ligase subunit beta [Acidobacteriota bacterium]